MAEGWVYFVGPESYGDCGSYANVVKIRHANGWETWYLHLAAFGDFPLIGTPANPNPDNPDGNLLNPIPVLQGHLLGRAGASGACYRHLHVELMQDATHHKSWDKQVIDGWTVHMDCGTPSVPGCDELNFDGYMHRNVPVFDALPWMKVGASANPTDNTPVPGGSLTALALAGTNTLHVPDISPYPLGAVLSINAGAANQEYKRFIAIGSLILDSPLQFDHAIGEPVGIVSSVAVGGIAEQPDVSALPSAAASSVHNYTVYIIGAAVASIVAAAGAAGWRRRRKRA